MLDCRASGALGRRRVLPQVPCRGAHRSGLRRSRRVFPLTAVHPDECAPYAVLWRYFPRRLGNRASYGLRRVAGAIYGDKFNDFLREVGLGRIGRLAYPLRNPDGSPVHVLPVPDHYPPSAHVTGYWFLDHRDGGDREPPAQLAGFRAAGEPPVYAGFGSIGFGKGANERRDAIIAALRVHGLRGIVATGWGSIPSRRCRLNCGRPAGGSADAGRAVPGGPAVLPARVHALGVGPVPLTARNLGTGLTDCLGELVRTGSYASRAEEVGAAIRAENSLAAGVRVLTQIAGVAATEV